MGVVSWLAGGGWMMGTRCYLVLAAVICSSVLLTCQEPPASTSEPLNGGAGMDGSLVPGTRPANVAPLRPPVAGGVGGVKPIVPTKPPVLGPVTPAVVVVPATMSEPMIRVKLTEESNSPPWVARERYRGRVEIVKTGQGKYVGINVLLLDDYLKGVLAKELYPSWTPTTYRAQAIVARTFALYQLLTEGKGKLWDVSDDTSSQMYGGIKGETEKARLAVEETDGMVLLGRDAAGNVGIFCARYSACAGGVTQDPYEAWGDPSIPQLSARSIGAIENISPSAHYSWPAMRIGKWELVRCLRSWGQRNGEAGLAMLGSIRTVTVTKRNATTKRPTEVTVVDSNGMRVMVRAEEMRIALLQDPQGVAPKPPSSNCEIRDEGDAIILVNGHGYGHGIGMSQWGAQALSLRGQTYTQILSFFYPGATLRRLW